MATLKTRIYTPRYGYEDAYTLEFTQESMTISTEARTTKCVWVESRDPQWTGESLESMLKNDHIYPPAILPRLLEHLWMSWRKGDLSEAEADAELQAVTSWLNEVTRAKPTTDFWRRYF